MYDHFVMEGKKKILIVEDENLLLNDLKAKFASEGFDVITATDGQEGLALALQNHPDLILLDIVMPIMDGMSMLYQLRKDDWGKNVEVILLTNLNEGEKIAQSYNEGVHDYLVKADWSLEDVVGKVKAKLV